MATTKIWPVKGSLKRVVDYVSNPEKTAADDLEAVINYAMNGDKTSGSDEKSCYVSGINCFAETAFEEMRNVQKLFGKTDGNVAYHCYQSFKPGEVTPELCHDLGIELARRMFGDKYQVLVATHLDRDHLHNHLVCCSVSFVDGKKFNDNKGAYARLRKLSDEICLENGMSVIEKPRSKTPRQLHFAEKNGENTKYNLMREAIDEAISLSANMPSFFNLMRQMGYEINYSPRRKYPTIRSLNSKKATRMYHLGEEYELHRISQRISDQSIDTILNNREEFKSPWKPPRRSRVRVNGYRRNARKITGIYALYLRYLYLMGYRSKKKHQPLSPEMKEACRMCDKYSDCAKLMARHHLRTEADVRSFISDSEQRMEQLSQERSKVRNRLRRAEDPALIEEQKSDRNALTEEISGIRKELKTAKFTLERSEKVKEGIQIERNYCRGDHLKNRNKDARSRESTDRDGR